MQAWTRSELKESALDYPERYETPERITLEADLRALATDRQRALVEMLGGSELAQEATRVEAGEEIDRLVAQRAYDQVERVLRERGMSEEAARERLARAVDRINAEDAAGGPRHPRGQGRRRLAHPRHRCAAGGGAARVRARSRGCHPSSRRGSRRSRSLRRTRPRRPSRRATQFYELERLTVTTAIRPASPPRRPRHVTRDVEPMRVPPTPREAWDGYRPHRDAGTPELVSSQADPRIAGYVGPDAAALSVSDRFGSSSPGCWLCR